MRIYGALVVVSAWLPVICSSLAPIQSTVIPFGRLGHELDPAIVTAVTIAKQLPGQSSIVQASPSSAPNSEAVADADGTVDPLLGLYAPDDGARLLQIASHSAHPASTCCICPPWYLASAALRAPCCAGAVAVALRPYQSENAHTHYVPHVR